MVPSTVIVTQLLNVRTFSHERDDSTALLQTPSYHMDNGLETLFGVWWNMAFDILPELPFSWRHYLYYLAILVLAAIHFETLLFL